MSYQTTLSKSQFPRSLGTTQDIPTNMTTNISVQKIPGSPGTTRDILGCPTKHDYQSPRSKNPKNSLDNPGYPRISQDVLPDLTTRVPGPNIPRYPETARDIPGCPSKHDYQSPRSQVVLGQLRTSRDVLQT